MRGVLRREKEKWERRYCKVMRRSSYEIVINYENLEKREAIAARHGLAVATNDVRPGSRVVARAEPAALRYATLPHRAARRAR
jgi:hypothetical protein